MKKKYSLYCESPLGILEITGSEEAVTGLHFTEKANRGNSDVPECLFECRRQLDEYFRGKRREFRLETELSGTEFQKKVLRELYKVPFGRTVSYGELARSIGNPKAVRAVGGANARNNIVIIYPCHRVIGSDGSMVGFGGGVWRKEWLLKHEQEVLSQDR
jgi:methylated-DNA-[protein]-cysteine S-methyltransferase